jgi:pyruvate dehydrogenase E1 component alpha subunit
VRDPIKLLANELISTGLATKEELNSIEHSVEEEIREAVDYALQAPEPHGSELTDFVWA